MQARHQYDRDRAKAVGEIYRRVWRWDAMCMQAADTAADVAALRSSGFVDVAYAWVRKLLHG